MSKKMGITIFLLHFILCIILFSLGNLVIIIFFLDFPFSILIFLIPGFFEPHALTSNFFSFFFFFAILGSLWWVYVVFTIKSIFDGKKVKLK